MLKIFYVGIISVTTSFIVLAGYFLSQNNNQETKIIQNIFQNEIPKEKINIQKEIQKVEEKKSSSKNKIIIISIIIIFFIVIIGFFLCYFFFWKENEVKDEEKVQAKDEEKVQAKKIYKEFIKKMMMLFKKGNYHLIFFQRNEKKEIIGVGSKEVILINENDSEENKNNKNKKIFVRQNNLKKNFDSYDDLFFIASSGLICYELLFSFDFYDKKIIRGQDFREEKIVQQTSMILSLEAQQIALNFLDIYKKFEFYQEKKNNSQNIKKYDDAIKDKFEIINKLKSFFNTENDDYYFPNEKFYDGFKEFNDYSYHFSTDKNGKKTSKEFNENSYPFFYKDNNGEVKIFENSIMEFNVYRAILLIAKRFYKKDYPSLSKSFLNLLLTNLIKLMIRLINEELQYYFIKNFSNKFFQ